MTVTKSHLIAHLTIALLTFAFANVAAAQDPGAVMGAAEDSEPRTIVRTYNVSDLLRGAGADQPRGAAVPGGFFADGPMPGAEMDPAMGGFAAPPAPAAASRVHTLIDIIQQLVAQESWRDNGGAEGQIKVFGQQLVIEQTPENHKRIAALLQDIRKEEGPAQMVSVQAYWVELDPDLLKQIHDAAAKQQQQDQQEQREPGGLALPEIPQELLNSELIYWRARTACFSGQTVNLSAGRSQNYLADLTPVVGTQAVGYDPKLQEVQSGVSLQVTAQLIPNSNVAVVDLSSRVSEVDPAMEKITFRTAVSPEATQPVIGSDGGAIVERLRTVTQQFATTVRVPLGKPVLVGGTTMQPAAPDQAARQIYLVLEVNSGE